MNFRALLGFLLLSASSLGVSGIALAADNDITAEIVRTRPLIEYRKTPAILHLEHKNGFPVMPQELQGGNGAPVSLYLVDPALSDFHHVQPVLMDQPGNYVFTVTPQSTCGYRIWAQIKPQSGAEQTAITDLAGAEKCKDSGERSYNLQAEAGHYVFKIVMDTDGLVAGTQTTLKVSVRGDGGRYISDLQPISGTFGKMVGFYDDYRTMAEVEPLGEMPTSYSDVAGPTLSYKITPEKPGYLKLFGQFRINDRIVTASFGLSVSDKQKTVSFSEDKVPMSAPVEVAPEPEEDKVAVSRDAERIAEMEAEEEALRKKDDTLSDLYVAPKAQASTDVYENTEQKILQWAAPEPDVEIVDDGGDEFDDEPERLEPVDDFR